MVERDRVDTIIVRDLSRFARNFLEAGHYLEFVFPAHGVRFISINDGYDSAAYGEVTAGLHVAIKNLLNQMYSKDISRKIKSAVDLKKMNGEYVYGTAPFGYQKGEVKNTIVVDPVAAPVVKHIFTLACAGKTITEISRTLNQEGVETPSVYLASVRGKYKTRGFWTYESVRNILNNRIYTGDTVPFKSRVVRVGSDHVRQLSEEEQIVLPNTHEAIITREMFEQAKTVVKHNVKSASKGKSSLASSYLVCGCCGNRLTKGKPQNKTFLCASARYTNGTRPDSRCKEVRCSEEKMKQILLRAIRQQCMMMDAHLKLIKAAAKNQKSEADAVHTAMRHQKRLLSDAQAAKMKLYEAYISGGSSKAEYLERKVRLNEKEESAKMLIALLEERLSGLSEKKEEFVVMEEEQELVSRYTGITELDDSLMQELVKRIVVFPDGSINIVWNFKDMTETEHSTIANS